MSALSLATLGVQCEARSLSMATLGVFCLDEAVITTNLPGGGSSKKLRKHIPGVTSNYSLALREDEELLEMIQSLLSTGYKF